VLLVKYIVDRCQSGCYLLIIRNQQAIGHCNVYSSFI